MTEYLIFKEGIIILYLLLAYISINRYTKRLEDIIINLIRLLIIEGNLLKDI